MLKGPLEELKRASRNHRNQVSSSSVGDMDSKYGSNSYFPFLLPNLEAIFPYCSNYGETPPFLRLNLEEKNFDSNGRAQF